MWTARTNPKGYGYTSDNGKMRTAHRASYEIFIGPIPDGDQVLHTCDTPSCVNPKHLFLGSNQDNVDDRVAKGRSARAACERNANAKLTPEQVEAIRSDPRSQRVIGEAYGVTQTNVSAIKRGVTWSPSTNRSEAQNT